jgi:O-antigen/teichoic acid export membrane protein
MALSDSRRLEERVARSFVYLVGSRIVIQVFGTVSALLVARWLSPADYGVIALAGTATIAVNMLGELGVGAAIIQFQDLEATELNAAFWATVFLSALLYATVYGAAPLLAWFFASPNLSPVLRVVGIGAFLSVLRVVPESLLRKRLDLDKVSIADIAAAGLSIPLVLGLAWAGAGVWALAAGAVFGPFVQCVLSFVLARWRPGLRVGSKRFRRLLTFSWAALGSKFSWSVYNQSDRVILGRLAGDVTLGVYAVANQVALLPIEKIATVINQILVPALAESQADRQVMSRQLLRGVRVVAWLIFPMCFGLMAFAGPAVPVVLTAKWSPIVPLLQVLCLYAASRSLALLFPPVLFAVYRADLLFLYNVVLLIVLPVGFGIGAWWNGALGVAAAWAILYPLVAAWMVHRALRALGMTWSSLGRELRSPALSTVVMLALASLAYRTVLGGSTAGLFLAILTGGLVHGAAFLLFGGRALDDVRSLFTSLRTRSAAPRAIVPTPDRPEP